MSLPQIKKNHFLSVIFSYCVQQQGTISQLDCDMWRKVDFIQPAMTGPMVGPRRHSKFSSVAQPCPTLCDPINCNMPGLPVHHQLLEYTQKHVHWVGDAIQPSHPLSSPSLPTFNLSQHHTWTKKRSWSLFDGLLPVWSTTAFWILVKPLHLRSMLNKSMRCTENCKASSQHWSTERAQFFFSTIPDLISHN